ncbi:CAF17-like 4Fe-4S cluster assembly/insertion protein YgfZ [Alteromonas stellipolaris]|uniref:CAF17-like 4Fe-4S cluster assembly/insertion protein YgfZ n=1 Tax=Alteromonas stellipolaris TaxID=233316 RepID=UPI0027377124|nr:glycine cleavage system protein T [Alteromonas stellipolaris]MDP2534354.1 glycine cleavage system protein T [Alteromonas stellipolaris]
MTALTTLSDLPSHYAIKLNDNMLIKLEGEQADSYLHGQVTVNINALDENTVRHCAHCDNKGKTWSISFVGRHENGRHENAIFMLTNKDAGAHSLAQLNKYGVFSKVDITDESNQYTQFFLGENLGKMLLASYFDTLPSEPLTSVHSDAGWVFKSDTQRAGYYVVLDSGQVPEFEQKVKDTNGAIFEQNVYDAIMIESAIPSIQETGISEYVPQMMNVQALNGIDFDKGCYMGQEVVARTRFLGKNKRAAYSFSVPKAFHINAGDTLEKQSGENWRRAGMVIRKAELSEETWFMAVLSNDTTEQDIHRLADQVEITCYPSPLPYSIEQAKSSLVKKRK